MKDPIWGWVKLFDADDTDFDLNSFLYDHYLLLSLRTDKKVVNGKLFNILLRRRLRQVAEERGLQKLGKQQQEDIKEAMEEELLGRALPTVNTYDMAWDIDSGEVLVFATSEAVLDYFRGLVRDSFGAPLRSERLADWLAERWDWSFIEQRVQQSLPGGLVEKGGELAADGWHESNPLEGHEFNLGSEFLAWLWHQSEERDGCFRLAQAPQASSDSEYEEAPTVVEDLGEPAEPGEQIVLWLDNKMILRDVEDIEQPGTTTMVGVAPSATVEAKLAVRGGKRPVEARLGIRRGDLEWYLSLRAGPAGLELAGLKLPTEVKQPGEAMIYERMFLLEFVSSTIKSLFRRFFELRTSERWPGLIEGWIERDLR